MNTTIIFSCAMMWKKDCKLLKNKLLYRNSHTEEGKDLSRGEKSSYKINTINLIVIGIMDLALNSIVVSNL